MIGFGGLTPDTVGMAQVGNGSRGQLSPGRGNHSDSRDLDDVLTVPCGGGLFDENAPTGNSSARGVRKGSEALDGGQDRSK